MQWANIARRGMQRWKELVRPLEPDTDDRLVSFSGTESLHLQVTIQVRLITGRMSVR